MTAASRHGGGVAVAAQGWRWRHAGRSQWALSDVDLAVEPGERAVVVIAAANRDPDIFDDPDRFRIDRDQRLPNLAFGHGPHRCLGAALARREVQIMLRALILRDPELAGTAVVRDTAILRGFDEVPILFRKGQPS